MNIALLTISMNIGGIEQVFAELSANLEKRGVHTYIFVIDKKSGVLRPGAKVIPVGFYYKPGILNLFLSWQYLVGVAWVKRRYKIDATISAPEYLNLVNLLTGGKTIPSLHNIRFQHEISPTLKDNFIERFFAKLTRRADSIICVSRAIEEKARRLYPGARVRTLYNGLDLEKIRTLSDTRPPEADGITLTPHTYVHVGRLVPQKAQDRLLRAFALVHRRDEHARLLILGKGHLEGELRELAETLGISEYVQFAGAVLNPYYYISRCLALVLSSDYEGFGLVITEALACGTPVVSVDCQAGPREILAPDTPIDGTATAVEHAEYGILTPLDDESLAQGMYELLTDDALRAAYAEKVPLRAADFDCARICDEWIKLLEEITRENI